MSIMVVKDRLSGYQCQSALEEQYALREITQELVLAALGRSDFFKSALFQGGTCLRIFYGLSRFSEDMDFVLKQADPDFIWKPYLEDIRTEMAAYGYKLETHDRSTAVGVVKKAFVKDDSIGKILHLEFMGASQPMGKINIKLEIDTNPPSGGNEEIRFLDFPFVSAVSLQALPTLFAGKTHALLCRDYVKGRDWYDFLWYTARKTAIDYDYLACALWQVGPWAGKNLTIDRTWLVETLGCRIKELDWYSAAEDVKRFISTREQKSLDYWNAEVFLAQLQKIR